MLLGTTLVLSPDAADADSTPSDASQTEEAARAAGEEASAHRVVAFAYGPPACASIDLARAAAEQRLVTSVVVGVDVVPRLSLGSVGALKTSLGCLHHEDGLMGRIEERRQARQVGARASGGDEASIAEHSQWSAAVLAWLRHEAGATDEREVLAPPGVILWQPIRDASSSSIDGGAAGADDDEPMHTAPAPDGDARSSESGAACPSSWLLADPKAFDSVLLCGSMMLTSHLPSSYLDAVG